MTKTAMQSILTGAGGSLILMVVNFAGSATGQPFSLSLSDLEIYMAVSGITSYLGAKLAVRYFNL